MKDSKEICPVCGSHSFVEKNDHVYRFKHGRNTHAVEGLSHSSCDECGISMFSPEQMKFNNIKVKDFQSRLKDYISPEQVLELREIYNITQSQANLIFGGGPTAFSKYERGLSSPSAGAARQMLAALTDHAYMAKLCARHDIKIAAPSGTHDIISAFIDVMPNALRKNIRDFAQRSSQSLQEACIALFAKGLSAADDEELDNVDGLYHSIISSAGHKKQVSGYQLIDVRVSEVEIPSHSALDVIKKAKVKPIVMHFPEPN